MFGLFGKKKEPSVKFHIWKLGLGPWILARDFQPSFSVSYEIWKARFRNAQYAIAESIFCNKPCGEKELKAIAKHVTGEDGMPQKSCGFAAFIYNRSRDFGDGPQWGKGEGLLWRLNDLLRDYYFCFPETEEEKKAREANEEPEPKDNTGDDILPQVLDFHAFLNAMRPYNVNFDGAMLLERAWNNMLEVWPIEMIWPLRLAARYILLSHDVYLAWEIFAYDQKMLERFKDPWKPGSLNFRNMLEIIS